jgi:hypothetical protein
MSTSIPGRRRPELGIVATYLRELRKNAAPNAPATPQRWSGASQRATTTSAQRRAKTPPA